MPVGRLTVNKSDLEAIIRKLRRSISGAAWNVTASSEGVFSFLDLDDTPGSFTGYGGYCVLVGAGETDLEFGLLDLDDLADVNAPAPNDGDVLTWDNVAGEWVAEQPPAGASGSGSCPCPLYDKEPATITISNSTSEEDLFTGTIVGGDLGINGFARLTLFGRLKNVTGTTRTFVLRVKFGSTTMFQDTSASIGSSADERPWKMEFLLGNKESEGVQVLGGSVLLGLTGGGAYGLGDISTDEMLIWTPIFGSASEDTSGNLDLDVTIQFSFASTDLWMTCEWASLEIFPGN